MLKKWFVKEKTKTLHNTPPNVPGIISVKTEKELLEQHQGRIVQINELAGLSSDNFKRFYLSAIHRYARFVQLCPASEVHHHAGLGGMLTHALEVCVMALKVRRSYLLSDTGDAEEISQKQDLWTYAVFIAALCHDLAKVAVDQRLIVYDQEHKKKQWQPWDKFIDEQGLWYTTEFVRNRIYQLHEKASPLLIHRIVPSQGIKWISSDQSIFSKWIGCISGDKDNASSIGEIVSIADGKSVAADLGADNSRMPTVKTKPLHEKMLTALRHLLMEGELPINRNGAAAWVLDDACWLVSKRTIDSIREQLTHEGHSGIPTKNGRIFDILQEHGVIVPCGEKAIWTATVESNEGWSHDLTLIKVETSKLWANASKKPGNFDGRIIAKETKSKNESAGTDNSSEKQIIKTEPEQLKNKKIASNSNSAKTDSQDTGQQNERTENKIPYKTLEPLKQEFKGTAEDDLDLLAFLPSISTSSTGQDEKGEIEVEGGYFPVVAEEKNSVGEYKKTNPDISAKVSKPSKVAFVNTNIAQEDVVKQFFSWLQEGIEKSRLITNQTKARIHVVNEGVILVTPGIFQDFAKTLDQDNDSWMAIQQKVLKKNWHVRDKKGLNVVKYQVKGQSKKTKVNAILFQDVSRVFGDHKKPGNNPHLIKLE